MSEPPSRPRPGPAPGPSIPDAVPDELPIGEAARRLGVTTDAVRKRLRRGTLAGRKTAAGWVVSWTEPTSLRDTIPDAGQAVSETAAALVRRLDDEVRFLRDQLATRDEEIRRRDVIINTLAESMRALPAPVENAPATRFTGSPRDEPPESASEPLRPGSDTLALTWRRWWRRVWGG